MWVAEGDAACGGRHHWQPGKIKKRGPKSVVVEGEGFTTNMLYSVKWDENLQSRRPGDSPPELKQGKDRGRSPEKARKPQRAKSMPPARTRSAGGKRGASPQPGEQAAKLGRQDESGNRSLQSSQKAEAAEPRTPAQQ